MLETLKFRYGRNAPYIRAVMYFMKFAFALVLINAAFAQQSIPAFDVVSIRPAISSEGTRRPVRTATSADRVDFVNVSLDDVLMRAYGITRSQIVAPNWVFTDRFDISATLPEGSKPEQVPGMLARMLQDRFHMLFRKENRQQDSYVLTVGKNGPKLKKSTNASTANSRKEEGEKKGTMTSGPGGMSHLEAREVTLDQFAANITKLLGTPVANQTGIEGTYDFTIDIGAEEAPRGEDKRPRNDTSTPANRDTLITPPASIFTSIQDYGLRLESRKVDLTYLIVEKADRVPTEN